WSSPQPQKVSNQYTPKKPLQNRGHQPTSVGQTDPLVKAPSSPLWLHQVWIKELVPKCISSLKS
ncbi:hypothetical protein LPJ54_005549, partial [Coemansia sp. RSA 1824]